MTLRLTSSQFPLLRAEGYDALQFLGGHAGARTRVARWGTVRPSARPL